MEENEVTLVTGGVRSGKSLYAEQLALSFSHHPVYVATARVLDGEMQARVHLHRARRGERWETVECPEALGDLRLPGRVVLVDCITMWITNLLCREAPPRATVGISDGGVRSFHLPARPFYLCD